MFTGYPLDNPQRISVRPPRNRWDWIVLDGPTMRQLDKA